MIIGQGMAAEARRVHERSLVSYYHKCLVEFGVPDYSEAQCWRDFEFQLFRPFLSLLTIAPSFARQVSAKSRGRGRIGLGLGVIRSALILTLTRTLVLTLVLTLTSARGAWACSPPTLRRATRSSTLCTRRSTAASRRP